MSSDISNDNCAACGHRNDLHVDGGCAMIVLDPEGAGYDEQCGCMAVVDIGPFSRTPSTAPIHHDVRIVCADCGATAIVSVMPRLFGRPHDVGAVVATHRCECGRNDAVDIVAGEHGTYDVRPRYVDVGGMRAPTIGRNATLEVSRPDGTFEQVVAPGMRAFSVGFEPDDPPTMPARTFLRMGGQRIDVSTLGDDIDEDRRENVAARLRALFPNGVPHEYSSVPVPADAGALLPPDRIGPPTTRESMLADLRALEQRVMNETMSMAPEHIGVVENSNRSTIDAARAHFLDARGMRTVNEMRASVGLRPIDELAREVLGAGGALIPPEMAERFLEDLYETARPPIGDMWGQPYMATTNIPRRRRFAVVPEPAPCRWCDDGTRRRSPLQAPLHHETRVRVLDAITRDDPQPPPAHMTCENDARAGIRGGDQRRRGDQAFARFVTDHQSRYSYHGIDPRSPTSMVRSLRAPPEVEWKRNATVDDARILRRHRASTERARQAQRRAEIRARVDELYRGDTIDTSSRRRRLSPPLRRPPLYVSANGEAFGGIVHAEYRGAALEAEHRERQTARDRRRNARRPLGDGWIDGPLPDALISIKNDSPTLERARAEWASMLRGTQGGGDPLD